MTRLLALLAGVGDRVNPVMVKEFRQAVQSRMVIAILVLFVLVNLCVAGGYLLWVPDVETSSTGGREVFTVLVGILLATCAGFVPLYVGTRMSLEHNETNVDLLFVTTITPGAIIRGKYLTAMALTLMIFSICMPFITLTYLLRGIDLPTIFLGLAGGFVLCAGANAAGIFAGCITGSWLMRGLVACGLAQCLLLAISGVATWTGALARSGTGFLNDVHFWAGAATLLCLEFLAIGLLYVLAVAIISPNPCNRMFVPRLYVMATWALVGILAASWDSLVPTLGDRLVPVWLVGSSAGFIVMMVAALGERDAWGARVRRTIPVNRLLRLFAFLLYTGSAGGIVWCGLMFAATALTAYAWVNLMAGMGSRADFSMISRNVVTVFGYILCYCLTTASFRSTLLKKLPTRHLWVAAALLGVGVFLVPYIMAFFLTSGDYWDVLPWYLMGSPAVLVFPNEDAKRAAELVLMGWLILSLPASLPWINEQWRRFTPYQITSATHSS